MTSGLANGVDGAAHRGALAADGVTVAILGRASTRPYPRASTVTLRPRSRHAGLSAQGVRSRRQRGAARNFPRRNRIIGEDGGRHAGGGGRQTQRLARLPRDLAAAQGREVFAVPGAIHNPLAKGCHALLRDGAKLVECAADVLSELGALVPDGTTVPETKGGRPRRRSTTRIIASCSNALDYMRVRVDTLIDASD